MQLKHHRRLIVVVGTLALTTALADIAFSQMFIGGRFMRRGPGQNSQPALAPPTRDAASIHLPRKNTVQMQPQVLTDGGNFRWDLYQSLNLGQGTDNAYSGGANLQINNQGFGGNGQGFAGKDGDEFEVGPYQVAGINFSRRAKVYKDQGLARWIDIFENPNAQETTINLAVYHSTCWQISAVKTSSGKAAFGDDDFGFVTELQQGLPPNIPVLMHLVCDRKAKLRPQVQVQGNQIWVRYSFRIPAKSSAAICYFESQGKEADHLKFMEDFKSAKYFKDLPASARRLILNFSNLGGIAGVDLERSDTADSILLQRGDPMFGTINNKSYTLQTLFGDLTLDAKQVIGMSTRPGGDAVFALLDGQIVSGKSAGTKLDLTLKNGGNLSIPLDQVQQWSYQIDKARPADITLSGPSVVLRTGDQLLFDAKSLKLDFSTRHGKLELLGSELVEINMDNASNGVHRATFINGSVLGGLLEGDKLAIPIKLAPKDQKFELPRNLVYKFSFGNDPAPDPANPRLVLANEDELYARITEPSLKVASEFGTTDIKPGSIKQMEFSPTHLDRVQVTLFDGTVLKGQLDAKDLNFQLTPATSLKISTAQIVSIEQSQAMASDEAVKKAEQAMSRLGSESYQDREKATEDLIKLGDQILPLLKKHLSDHDPEVRQRILRVMEKAGGKGDVPEDLQPMMMMN